MLVKEEAPTLSDAFFLRLGWAALALLAGCSGPGGPDVVIQHDHQVLRGALQRCTAEACTLNGKTIARSSIDWIGLRRQPPPPGAQSAVADEVHLTDGSVHSGTLVTVDAATVVMDSGAYPRDRVEWIHLGKSETGEVPTATEGNPGDASAKFCPVDRPLGGRVMIDYVERFGPSFYVGPAESQNRIWLWFPLVPAYQPYVVQGKEMQSSPTAPYELAAPTLNYEVSTTGYTSSTSGSDCKVPAQSRNGSIRFGDYDAAHVHPGLKFIRFRALYPDLTVQEPDEVDSPWPDQGVCRDRAHPDQTALATAPSIMSEVEIGPDSCGKMPNNFCANPGYCSLGHTIADPSARQECLARPEKHAVIPFSGTGTHSGEFDEFPSVHVKWEVCCGCGTRPDTGAAPDDGKNR
jgi:hypothetical protein